MPANVDAMVKGCVPDDVPLAFTLDRSHCIEAPLAGKSHATLKDLNRIWSDKTLNPSRLWSSRNTVLIDDSPSKAARTPSNLLPVPTFELKPLGRGGGGGGGGDDTVLETLGDMLMGWKVGVDAQQWCKENYTR
jgi:hypothetical protein